MRNFDFYEFVGLIVPGALLLVGVGALWPSSRVDDILLPTTTGAAVIHLVGAYAAGHMIQAVANLAEGFYWRLWGGMPTDWAFSRPKRAVRTTAIPDAMRASGVTGKVEDLKTWQQVLSSARAKVYDAGAAGRIGIFNGSYSLFRGLTVCGLAFLASAWSSDQFKGAGYPVLAALTLLSAYRLHHFALLYARELHACIANIANVGHKDGN